MNLLYRYGKDYIDFALLYHLSRLDHRHNFSVYNLLLYYLGSPKSVLKLPWNLLAFAPQFLCSFLICFACNLKYQFVVAVLLQSQLFVTFNKVSTSQVSHTIRPNYGSIYSSHLNPETNCIVFHVVPGVLTGCDA